MIGTLINCLAIILGSSFGLLLRRGMKDSISKTVMQGVGLSVILIGVTGAIETQNTLLVILSMVIGGVLGAWINIDSLLPSRRRPFPIISSQTEFPGGVWEHQSQDEWEIGAWEPREELGAELAVVPPIVSLRC